MHDGPRNRFTSPRLFGATVAVVLAAAVVMAQDQPQPPAAFSIVPILEGVPIEGNRVQIRRGDEVRFRWLLNGAPFFPRSVGLEGSFQTSGSSTPAERLDKQFIGEPTTPNAPLVFLRSGTHTMTFRAGRQGEESKSTVVVEVLPNDSSPAHAVLESLTTTKTLQGVVRLEATVLFALDGSRPDRILCQALRLFPQCPEDNLGDDRIDFQAFDQRDAMLVKRAYQEDTAQWRCEDAALEQTDGDERVWRASFSLNLGDSPVQCEPVRWRLVGVGVLPDGQYRDFFAEFRTPFWTDPDPKDQMQRWIDTQRRRREAPAPEEAGAN